jgi:hypothetical protein
MTSHGCLKLIFGFLQIPTVLGLVWLVGLGLVGVSGSWIGGGKNPNYNYCNIDNNYCTATIANLSLSLSLSLTYQASVE